MNFNKQIKTIDKKNEQNKNHYNLDKPTAKISALASGNFGKYKFLTGGHILPEKELLEKVATIKILEYSLFDSEVTLPKTISRIIQN